MELKELQKCSSFFCEKIFTISWSSPAYPLRRTSQAVKVFLPSAVNPSGPQFLCSSAILREEKRKKEYGAPQFCGAGCKDAKASGRQTGKNPPRRTRSGPQFLCVSASLRE
jgi:hypothetical protein